MTKKELSQLYYLNREIEQDEQRLRELEDKIREDEEYLEILEAKAASPSSSDYSGMPKATTFGNKLEDDIAHIDELRRMIQKSKELRSDCAMTIRAKQMLCITEQNKLERYIRELPNSLLRLIYTYRFINGLTWFQVAESIGGRCSEDSVKKAFYRYQETKE